VIDPWFLPIRQIDLHHIEAPGDIPVAEAPQPIVRTAFDQPLLFLVHGIQWADGTALPPGLDLDEEQQLPIAGDDVHLATTRSTEVPVKDLAAVCPQPSRGDVLTPPAHPHRIAELAVSRNQTAATIERRAETRSDGGGKGRDAEAPPDAPGFRILGVGRSHIGETRREAPASCDPG